MIFCLDNNGFFYIRCSHHAWDGLLRENLKENPMIPSPTTPLMSLGDLAKLAARVDEQVQKIRNRIWTFGSFNKLREDIDLLQRVTVPELCQVVEACVAWLDHGLDSFEHDFVVPVEKGVGGWEHWNQDQAGLVDSPPRLLIGWWTIEKYLEPTSFDTSESFIRICRRVEELTQRLTKVTKGTKDAADWIGRNKKANYLCRCAESR